MSDVGHRKNTVVFDRRMVVFHPILISTLWCSPIPCEKNIKILKIDFNNVITNELYCNLNDRVLVYKSEERSNFSKVYAYVLCR